MYVIFPAEDVVELSFGRSEANELLQNQQAQPTEQHCCNCNNCSVHRPRSAVIKSASIQHFWNILSINGGSSSSSNGAGAKTDSNKKSKSPKSSKAKTNLDILKMAANMNEPSLKDLSHPTFNDQLKSYNTATFKLVRTVSDFSQELARAYEDHATTLQNLVTNYRKKSAELRKERPSCSSTLFHIWESLLQEVEVDSQAQTDVASVLARQVSRPLLDRSFHRKVQARKIFGHRDSFEIIINKAEEKLMKCRQDYKAAYTAHLSANNSTTLSNYIEAHNTYVRQLHAVNAMVEQYSKETLPLLLQELEDVYADLCNTVSESVQQGAEIIATRSLEQCKRYEGVGTQCKMILPSADIVSFVKYLSPLPAQSHPSHRRRAFIHPLPPNTEQDGAVPGTSTSDYSSYNESNSQLLPKNELVTEHMHPMDIKEKYDGLRMETVKLEAQVKQLQDSLDTMLRIQQKSLESSLFNKANELQEDISMKRYDLRMAQIQLAAVQAQRELFGAKLESIESSVSRDRKLSAASTTSMKSKWLKAFKSLKTSSPNGSGSAKDASEKKNGREGFQITNSPELVHQFQEYTYKKITPCDVCSQVLRGHTRQGLKCRLCKMNVHLDCQEKVTTKCQTKSRLLRRQKSTSEIETRNVGTIPDEEVASLPNTPVNHSSGSVSPSPGGRRVSWKKGSGSNTYSRKNSPNIEQIQYAAGTRPFGQPLMLSRGPPENGDLNNPKQTPKTNSSGPFGGLFKKH